MWNPRAFALECRDVLAAWLVCMAIAAACLGLPPLAAALDGGGRAALINPAPIATVAAAGTDPAGSCEHARRPT